MAELLDGLITKLKLASLAWALLRSDDESDALPGLDWRRVADPADCQRDTSI